MRKDQERLLGRDGDGASKDGSKMATSEWVAAEWPA